MFRYFGSKVGVFQAAMVQPFVEFVQAFVAQAEAGDFSDVDDETASRLLIGGLFDLFHAHRGLVTMFWSADVMGESELSESGVLGEVQEQFDALIAFGRSQMRVRHSELPAQYLDDPGHHGDGHRHGRFRRVVLWAYSAQAGCHCRGTRAGRPLRTPAPVPVQVPPKRQVQGEVQGRLGQEGESVSTRSSSSAKS